MELEHKFCRLGAEVTVAEGSRIEGYASVFGACDQGGDVVAPGAYAQSLARLAAEGRGVKMLWQHDPAQPIGIWDEVREDGRGLWVRGRLLDSVVRGREAAVDRLSHAACQQGCAGAQGFDGTGALGSVAGDLPDAARCAGGGQGREPRGRPAARSGAGAGGRPP